MCVIFFKKTDFINYKIIAFEMEKRVFFLHPTKCVQANFGSSWFKSFGLHEVDVFDITLRNLVENP
jgi:hypothetical protein